MALDITGLQDYAKANSEILIDTVIMAGTSMNPKMGLNVYDDVKTADEVPDITAVSCVLQEGDPSDTSALGNDTMVSIKLEDKQLTLHKRYSTYDLDRKLTQLAKKQGSAPDDDAYLSLIADLTATQLTLENDKILWLGDKTKSDNLGKFDGFVKQILAGTPIKTGAAPVKLTTANSISKVEALVGKYVDAKPQLVGIKARLFMSPENFFIYRRALVKQGMAIDANTIKQAGDLDEILIPGTNFYATSVPGLATDNHMILCRPELLIPVTDSATEDSKITLEYLNEAMKFRLMAIFKLGAKAAHIGEIAITAV